MLDLVSGTKRIFFAGDAVQPSVSPHGLRVAYWDMRGGQRFRRIDAADLDARGHEPMWRRARRLSKPQEFTARVERSRSA